MNAPFKPPRGTPLEVLVELTPADAVAFCDVGRGCRWIYGRAGWAALTCGRPTLPGKSWCGEHYERVFRLRAS